MQLYLAVIVACGVSGECVPVQASLPLGNSCMPTNILPPVFRVQRVFLLCASNAACMAAVLYLPKQTNKHKKGGHCHSARVCLWSYPAGDFDLIICYLPVDYSTPPSNCLKGNHCHYARRGGGGGSHPWKLLQVTQSCRMKGRWQQVLHLEIRTFSSLSGSSVVPPDKLTLR